MKGSAITGPVAKECADLGPGSPLTPPPSLDGMAEVKRSPPKKKTTTTTTTRTTTIIKELYSWKRLCRPFFKTKCFLPTVEKFSDFLASKFCLLKFHTFEIILMNENKNFRF